MRRLDESRNLGRVTVHWLLHITTTPKNPMEQERILRVSQTNSSFPQHALITCEFDKAQESRTFINEPLY